jgi:hypothetical protein
MNPQVQVKGTAFLYRHFKDSCNDSVDDRYLLIRYHKLDFQSKFRRFYRLRLNLLNFALHSITNTLSNTYVDKAHELVRPIFYVSARSINNWTRNKLRLPDSSALLELLQTEDERFRDYWSDFFAALLPKEASILNRAVAMFESVALENPTTEWTQALVAQVFDACLTDAKTEFNYDDSYNAVFRTWMSLDFLDVKEQLPKKLTPTVI